MRSRGMLTLDKAEKAGEAPAKIAETSEVRTEAIDEIAKKMRDAASASSAPEPESKKN